MRSAHQSHVAHTHGEGNGGEQKASPKVILSSHLPFALSGRQFPEASAAPPMRHKRRERETGASLLCDGTLFPRGASACVVESGEMSPRTRIPPLT